MATTAGLVFSTFLGLTARRLQVLIVGKEYARSFQRVPGYVYSVGLFVGGYYLASQVVDNNRQLLQRRLAVLREQRAQKDAFHEFDDTEDQRWTAGKRNHIFGLLDKYGAGYK